MSLTSLIVLKSSQWNVLHLIPMKSRCLSYNLCEAWHRGSKAMPFFRNSYMYIQLIEKVSLIFHSFQVINMILFLCGLIYCDKEGLGYIVIKMYDSSISFLTSKPIFQLFAIYNMRLSCLEMDHRSFKTAKMKELDPWPRLCPGPKVGSPQASSIIFRFSSFGNRHPCF